MIRRIINFYSEGFSNMRLGKTLWLVVLVKLVVIFVVLRLFFMPDIPRSVRTFMERSQLRSI